MCHYSNSPILNIFCYEYMGVGIHKEIIVIGIVNSKRELQLRKRFYYIDAA